MRIEKDRFPYLLVIMILIRIYNAQIIAQRFLRIFITIYLRFYELKEKTFKFLPRSTTTAVTVW